MRLDLKTDSPGSQPHPFGLTHIMAPEARCCHLTVNSLVSDPVSPPGGSSWEPDRVLVNLLHDLRRGP